MRPQTSPPASSRCLLLYSWCASLPLPWHQCLHRAPRACTSKLCQVALTEIYSHTHCILPNSAPPCHFIFCPPLHASIYASPRLEIYPISCALRILLIKHTSSLELLSIFSYSLLTAHYPLSYLSHCHFQGIFICLALSRVKALHGMEETIFEEKVISWLQFTRQLLSVVIIFLI